GPQGTLFGRNTPAGVVKFESVKPSQEFGGYARLGYGSDDMVNFEGAVGGALGPRWSARLSALYPRPDGSVRRPLEGARSEGFEGYHEAAVRVQFLYEGEDFEALLNLHRRDLNGTARLFRANIIEPGTNRFVEGFSRGRVSVD